MSSYIHQTTASSLDKGLHASKILSHQGHRALVRGPARSVLRVMPQLRAPIKILISLGVLLPTVSAVSVAIVWLLQADRGIPTGNRRGSSPHREGRDPQAGPSRR